MSNSEASTVSSARRNSPEAVRDRSTGWLAQPAVHLQDLSCGFQPQTEVVDCKP